MGPCSPGCLQDPIRTCRRQHNHAIESGIVETLHKVAGSMHGVYGDSYNEGPLTSIIMPDLRCPR